MPRIDVPFTVTEQVLRQYPPTLLRAGDKNYFYATFDVCEKWADVAELRAVFERSDLERPYVQDLVQDNGRYECVISWEVMQTPGLVRVGVFGGDRILTNKVEVSVSVGCRCDGDAPRSPTRDWFLRVEDHLNNLEDHLNNFEGVNPATTEKLGVIKVGNNLEITEDGVLSVTTTNEAEKDNTKPITSAGVYTQVGNIEILLAAL